MISVGFGLLILWINPLVYVSDFISAALAYGSKLCHLCAGKSDPLAQAGSKPTFLSTF
jgi:hypothetical protein